MRLKACGGEKGEEGGEWILKKKKDRTNKILLLST